MTTTLLLAQAVLCKKSKHSVSLCEPDSQAKEKVLDFISPCVITESLSTGTFLHDGGLFSVSRLGRERRYGANFLLKLGYNIIVRIVPIVPKIDETIGATGAIIWKLLDSFDRPNRPNCAVMQVKGMGLTTIFGAKLF